MKIQLATEEGVEMPDGRTIEVGAMKLNGEVPVTIGADYSNVNSVVGKARDLTREDDKMFVDVEFKEFEKFDEDFVKTFSAHVWANELTEVSGVIKHGNIRAINLFANPGFPKEVVDVIARKDKE